jgi:hypothetical protein
MARNWCLIYCPPEELMFRYGLKFEGSLVLDISDYCQTCLSP